MSTGTFGAPFRLPYVYGGRVEVPVGQPCLWCAETLQDDDQGVSVPCVELAKPGQRHERGEVVDGLRYYQGAYHRWCYVRAGQGSVQCQQARERGEVGCRHPDGETPETGTKREHAVAAATYYYGGELPE